MLNHSEQIDQLASALAEAQSDLGAVFKQRQNDAFGSKYADLARVWEAFQRVGPRHGLSVVQMPGRFDAVSRTMSMSVKLMHNSGQWLGGDMTMPLSRGDAHAYGSACTYARRYSLAALIGICPHDDDGNAASGVEASHPAIRQRAQWGHAHAAATPTRPSSPAPRRKGEAGGDVQGLSNCEPAPAISTAAGVPVPADPQGFDELRRLAAAAQVGEAALCQHYRVASLSDLSPRDAARARRALGRKVDALAQGAS